MEDNKHNPDVGTSPSSDSHRPDYSEREQVILAGEKSPGVARIEAINAHMTLFDRIVIGLGVFLIAYAYGLDGTVRYTYQVSYTSR